MPANDDIVSEARGAVQAKQFYWNTTTGAWEAVTTSGGSAVTVADGADVTIGAIADAAVASDTTGTISGKLRGLVKILANVWDSGNSRLNVAFSNTSIAATQSGVWSVGHGKTLKTVTGTKNTIADHTLVSAVALKRIKVVAYALFSADTTINTLTFKDNTAGTAVWTVPLQSPAAGSIHGANLTTDAPSFLFASTAGNPLVVALSAAVVMTYSLTYFDDDAT